RPRRRGMLCGRKHGTETSVGVSDHMAPCLQQVGEVLSVSHEVFPFGIGAVAISASIGKYESESIVGQRLLGCPLLDAGGQAAVDQHDPVAMSHDLGCKLTHPISSPRPSIHLLGVRRPKFARSCYLVKVSVSDTYAESGRRSDGEATHASILEAAMRLASVEGLGSLTIGRLARELGLSKSGVFAHFRSKQRLQRETIEAAEAVFMREVIEPAMAASAGWARVEALCYSYLSYVERGVFPGGCFFAQLLAEFDGTSGDIHELVVIGQRGWLGLLTDQITTAQHQGEAAEEVEAEQLAFELYGHLELANYLATLYRDPAMVERGRRAVRSTLAAA